LIWQRIREEAGPLESDNEPSALKKSGKFLDFLRDCYFLKKDSAPWSLLVG